MSGTSVKVALVQCEVSGEETPADRLARVSEVVRTGCTGAQVVVLPELWLAGAFDMAQMQVTAQSRDGEFVTAMCSLAKECGIWLHAGSFVERDSEGHLYNTALVISPAGDVTASYRKQHLWGGDSGEAVLLARGRDVVTAQLPFGTAGIATCYDLRFPEQFRALVDVGATSFIIPASWPVQRIEHWRVLLRARAIENQAWVLAVNSVGTHAGTTMGGCSAVIDPTGVVVCEASGDEEIVLFAEVAESAVTAWRSRHRWLADRI
jgi:predicted amidohydrolase